MWAETIGSCSCTFFRRWIIAGAWSIWITKWCWTLCYRCFTTLSRTSISPISSRSWCYTLVTVTCPFLISGTCILTCLLSCISSSGWCCTCATVTCIFCSSCTWCLTSCQRSINSIGWYNTWATVTCIFVSRCTTTTQSSSIWACGIYYFCTGLIYRTLALTMTTVFTAWAWFWTLSWTCIWTGIFSFRIYFTCSFFAWIRCCGCLTCITSVWAFVFDIFITDISFGILALTMTISITSRAYITTFSVTLVHRCKLPSIILATYPV